MIFIVIISLFLIFSLCLCIGLYILLKKYKRLREDVYKIYLAIKRVRYGDINVRVENLNNKELETTINRHIETINDREMMIKEYQSTLARKNLSLEEVLKQEKELQLFKEEFAATLTHDMKVPVIAELNSLNYLLDGRFGDLNQKQREILMLMKSSNQELKDLIENMLETYRLEQKKLELDLSLNDFNSFLDSCIKEMQPNAFNTKHRLVSDFSQSENLKISFDAFQLKRVVKNLLNNAITFSPNETDIEIYTKKYNDEIKLYIRNKGQGISPEDLDLIFHKYYSGQSKFRKAGTGLGLYLSRQIILAHNGKIEVETEPEKYTTFVMTLPL